MRDVDKEALEAAARAHDREEAAQKGEPSPWRDLDYSLPGDADWRDERIAAMREAIAAYLSAREAKGWREMPREPTLHMAEEAFPFCASDGAAIWERMFDAAAGSET